MPRNDADEPSRLLSTEIQGSGSHRLLQLGAAGSRISLRHVQSHTLGWIPAYENISATDNKSQQRRYWPSNTPNISVADVAGSKERRAKTTQADKDAARRLKAKWDALPRSERPTQEEMGAALSEDPDNPVTQGAVSQYLNGVIPLNFRTVLIFARELRCRPEEIRSDLLEFELAHEFWDVKISPPHPKSQPPRRPFGILQERVDDLDTADKRELEGFIEAQLRHLEANKEQRKQKPRRVQRQ